MINAKELIKALNIKTTEDLSYILDAYTAALVAMEELGEKGTTNYQVIEEVYGILADMYLSAYIEEKEN